MERNNNNLNWGEIDKGVSEEEMSERMKNKKEVKIRSWKTLGIKGKKKLMKNSPWRKQKSSFSESKTK